MMWFCLDSESLFHIMRVLGLLPHFRGSYLLFLEVVYKFLYLKPYTFYVVVRKEISFDGILHCHIIYMFDVIVALFPFLL